MTLETLARKHKVKITIDECGDKIIKGTRGHVYVDNGFVCAIGTDSPTSPARLRALDARVLVLSEAYVLGKRHLRDFRVYAIDKDKVGLALTTLGCRQRAKQAKSPGRSLRSLPEERQRKGTQEPLGCVEGPGGAVTHVGRLRKRS